MTMSRAKLLPALVLTVALSGLAATVGYAVVRSDDGWGSGQRGLSMMTATGQAAPWYAKGSGQTVQSIAGRRANAHSGSPTALGL